MLRPRLIFFFFFLTALHRILCFCFLLAYSNQSWCSGSFYIGFTVSWWYWLTLCYKYYFLSVHLQVISVLLQHTPSRNLGNHRFTSASKVPAAFTKIHIVSLCVCFVQLLFMCLEMWLPTLLMVELLVFYVLLLLLANICSNAADLLRLSVYIVWVVALHTYYDAVMRDVDFCCDEKHLMSDC